MANNHAAGQRDSHDDKSLQVIAFSTKYRRTLVNETIAIPLETAATIMGNKEAFS